MSVPEATSHGYAGAFRVIPAPASWDVTPNLTDYGATRASFTWEAARAGLEGLPGGGLNIAHEALDRHVAAGRGAHVAIRWLARAGDRRDFTYAELSEQANRFANVLANLGVQRGQRVFSLAGRIPELYVAALGTWKYGAVFSPLFSAFGPEPIKQRLAIGDGRVLVTTSALYARKVAGIRAELAGLAHVLVVARDGEEIPAGTLGLDGLLRAASDRFATAATMPADEATIHFTSGTTGKPKGAVHVHEAVVAHHITGSYALDLRPDDIFWCTADPGWVTGTSYGIISPLTHGLTSIVDEAEFDAEHWYQVLDRERVTVWYTAPTAIRMLMRAGADLARSYNLSSLRFAGSVGEPLNPEAVVWGTEALGLPFHDNWWQTETGGIVIANFRAVDIRPGSMGLPLPGFEVGIVDHREDGGVSVIDRPDVDGELAIRPGWPSMFRGYLGDEERYRKAFANGWYLTGDLARRDGDGYYWFVGRADDVIKSSGHLIGPFEVESALLEHVAVAEAGVIGKPDAIAGNIVKAFVSLKPGFEESDALRRELLGHARQRLGAAVAPKEIAFLPALPRTRSGKIMRRLLRAWELGLPEGDLSTLESS
ncbi:MAG: acetate--CoA ligase [Chloroflexi bacterium]|nr:acetate--CoA ligase [Chloroflexota bacterium]